MKLLRIATRQSQLALAQANLIKRLLQEQYPALEISLVGITTQGDKIQDKPLADIGGKGLFLKELQQALLSDAADIAVHSLKDVPVEDVLGLSLTAFCQRQDVRDVLVSTRYSSFSALPKGAIVGTSSYRRQAQLLAQRPDLVIKNLRGNVDTRVKKLLAGEYDAIVLAAAGMIRLGLQQHITEYFDLKTLLPSVGQGALVIEARTDDKATQELVSFLNQPLIQQQVTAERAFTKALQADCHTPVAVHATISKGQLTLDGLVASLNGQKVIRAKKIVDVELAEQAGQELAAVILKLGGDKILQEVKACSV